MKYIVLLFLLFILLPSCNVDKEVDLKLPEYKNEMVIECYLTPGKPFRLCIFESVGYFASPIPPTVDSAFVTITYNGVEEILKFKPQYDSEEGKFYNYASTTLVPYDYNNTFELYVKDKKGRTATSHTKIFPAVAIDTVYFKYSPKDSMAAPVTIFHDDPTTKNYYRYTVQKNSKKTVADFQVDDVFLQSSKVELNSSFNIERGSDVAVSLYPISKEFYDYYQSLEDARNANGNPFGQPSAIKSNVNGSIGIFTGLAGVTIKKTVP